MVSFDKKLIALSLFIGLFSPHAGVCAEKELLDGNQLPTLAKQSVSSTPKPSIWGEWINLSRKMTVEQTALRAKEQVVREMKVKYPTELENLRKLDMVSLDKAQALLGQKLHSPTTTEIKAVQEKMNLIQIVREEKLAAQEMNSSTKSVPQSSRSWFQFAKDLGAVATQAITDPGAFVLDLISSPVTVGFTATLVEPFVTAVPEIAKSVSDQLDQAQKLGAKGYASHIAESSWDYAKEHPRDVFMMSLMAFLRLNGVRMVEEEMSFPEPTSAVAVPVSSLLSQPLAVQAVTSPFMTKALYLSGLGLATAGGFKQGKMLTGFAQQLKNRNFVEKLGTVGLCGFSLYLACHAPAAAATTLIPSLGASVQISQTGQNVQSISSPIEVPGDTVCVLYQVGTSSPEIWGACTYTANTTNLFQMAIAPGSAPSAALYSSNTILLELVNSGKIQIVPWNFVTKTVGTVQTISPVTTDFVGGPGIAASNMQALASFDRSSAAGYRIQQCPVSGPSYTLGSVSDMVPLQTTGIGAPVLAPIPSGLQAVSMWLECAGCSVGVGTGTFQALSTYLNGTATSSVVSVSSALSNANTIYGPLMTPISLANNVFGGWIYGTVPQGLTIGVGGALGTLHQVSGFTSPSALCLGSIPNTNYLLWAVQDAPSLISNNYLVVTDYTTGAVVTGITQVASSSASPTVIGYQAGNAGYFSGKAGVVSYIPISFSQGSTTATTSSGTPASTGTTVATTSGAPASTGPASTGPASTTSSTSSGGPTALSSTTSTSGATVATTATTGNGNPTSTGTTTGATSTPKQTSASSVLQPGILLPVVTTLGTTLSLLDAVVAENFFSEWWKAASGVLGTETPKARADS